MDNSLDIPWQVIDYEIGYDSDETEAEVKSLDWRDINVHGRVKIGHNYFTSMMNEGVEEDKLTVKTAEI